MSGNGKGRGEIIIAWRVGKLTSKSTYVCSEDILEFVREGTAVELNRR